MEWKLELVAVPVSDVDRAKAFYTETVGLHADHDQQVNENLRFVQLTPPGSSCSICIGIGLTKMAPGSLEGLQMVVPDIEQAHRELASRGADVSAIEDLPWGRFVYFSDPDGNKWAVQELPRWAGQALPKRN
jgi:predicted enzyme related to lactoylglutathione lyase